MIQGFKAWRGEYSIGDYTDLGMPLDHEDIVKVLRDNLDVTHVVIPHTNTGYGAGVLEYSNQDALDRDYGKRLHKVKLDYAFTRLQVIRYPDLWDIISGLAYDYPILDDDAYHEREYLALIEFVTEELFFSDGVEDDRDTVRNWLADNVELWGDGETVYLENSRDVYMSKDSLATLLSAYRAKN